ncbi:MAG: hypothetical protein AMJ79_11615 [Phycisphaerae bacterium SM23_30]|nr:MAG: hypothetical protein AMJ79_11615 [Phycisphaerae bacterium SM23_30]
MAIDSSQREKLYDLLRMADIPTLPMVAQKLIDLCKDEDTSLKDLVRIIETDQGLACRVMSVANSAYYGLRYKATTLDRAILALGFEYVKSISLGFHIAHTLSKFTPAGFDVIDFWRQNILRGIMARQVAAAYCAQYREEAFLIGLLQDSGILLLVQAFGDRYARLYRDTRNSQICHYRLEQEVFEIDHVKAASVLADRWSLPEVLARPIRTHHDRRLSEPNSDQQLQLCQIAYFVGSLSFDDPKLLCGEDLALSDYCHRTFDISPSDLNILLDHMREEFISVVQMFTGILPEKVDITELVVQAKNLLSDLANNANRKIFALEEEVKQLRLQCEDLFGSLCQYQYLAKTDDLTGLTLRIPLESYLDKACQKVKSCNTTLTIIFVDIDNFKTINDTHSHAVGDRVLQLLAKLLAEQFGNLGCVCRYGGDEFVLACTGLKLKHILHHTKILLRKIKQLEIPVRSEDEQRTISFSCSIGLLFCESGSQPGNSVRVLELADNQMREVKKHGKNGIRFQVIDTSKDAINNNIEKTDHSNNTF